MLKADVGFHHHFRQLRIVRLTMLIVDYNSWVESDKARKLRKTLDPDVVLAEGG